MARGDSTMSPRIPHRVTPMTRRDWLLHAGAGFGALALGDLLALEVSAVENGSPTSGPAAGPLARIRRRRGA